MTNQMLISDILARYGIQEYSNRFQGRCPIHNGDNNSAFCLYKETGVWKCFTHRCHELFGSRITGLMKALGINANAVDVSKYSAPLIKDITLPEIPHHPKLMKRETFRELMQDIPSEYFINRGFSKAILDRYDVGTCTTKYKYMYNRAVVPIYDMNQEYTIGYTGRDITDKSDNKWKHSQGYRKSRWLYNIWNAKEEIANTHTAILVEGPGDVWKLEEAGIKCGLGIMGTSVSYDQKILLSYLGVSNILILTDLNDEPGKKAADDIYKSLKNLYNICIPQLDFQDDIGDSSVRWIIDNIEPILRKCFQ